MTGCGGGGGVGEEEDVQSGRKMFGCRHRIASRWLAGWLGRKKRAGTLVWYLNSRPHIPPSFTHTPAELASAFCKR